MAVTITRYNYGSHYSGTREVLSVETLHVGRVLSSERITVNVDSDHAMIDSGNRLVVTYWDTDLLVVKSDTFHTDDMAINTMTDATPEVLAVAAEYQAAVGKARTLADAVHAAHRWSPRDLKRGDVVEVYMGRKCPYGKYTVRSVANGAYGWYADLYAATGDKFFMAKVHQYVSLNNLRRPDDPWDAFDRSAIPEGWATEWVRAVFHAGYSLTPWVALCDRLDEQGDPDGAHVRNAILNGWIFGYGPEVNEYRRLAAGAAVGVA